MAAAQFILFTRLTTLLLLVFASHYVAQDTRAGTRGCVFQDGSHLYRLQSSDDGNCPSPIDLQRNLNHLNDFVQRQVYAVESKMAEIHNTYTPSLRELHQQIAEIKHTQHLQELVMRTQNRLLQRLQGFTATGTSCKGNYVQNGTSCYNFVEHASTWFDSEAFCMSQGAHLVAIETMAENSFLNSYLMANPRYKIYNWWTGGNDVEVEGQWRWLGTGEEFTVSKWAPGEPSNSGVDTDGNAGSEQCMWMHASLDWNDARCESRTYFICEMELLQTTKD